MKKLMLGVCKKCGKTNVLDGNQMCETCNPQGFIKVEIPMVRKCNYCNNIHIQPTCLVMCDGMMMELTLCYDCKRAMHMGDIEIKEIVRGKMEYWNHIDKVIDVSCQIEPKACDNCEGCESKGCRQR